MSSSEGLRQLISERLTAAAAEIFGAFQATITKYEAEIDRQSRLLELVLKPEVKLHRIELQQQRACKEEEEVPADWQLCDQERNSSLEHHEPDPPQVKEEQEELCSSLDREQLVLKQETQTFMLFPTWEDSGNRDDQSLDSSPDGTEKAAENDHVVIMPVKNSPRPEPNSGDQLLFHNSEGQDHQGDSGSIRNTEQVVIMPVKNSPRPEPNSGDQLLFHNSEGQDHQGDPGSIRNTEQQPQEIHANNSTTSTIHSETYAGKECFKCDTCGKSYKHKSRLHSHLRVHTGEKPYPCGVCERRFSMVAHLNEHMRVHTGERPHPCNICEKRFSKSSALKVHMRSHTGERPYPCNTCGKRYVYLDALKVHMRTHTGERPYPCNTCEKRFFKPSALKVHMRVHTGEKPYLCSTCKRSFSHLETLKAHMRIHTDEKPYECNICGRDFRHIKQLKVHMKTHSGKDSVRCQT